MTVAPVLSAQAAAYALCRGVTRAPARAPLRDLLRDLNISRHSDGRPGRGIFGQYASRAAGQFAGYLKLDASRAQLPGPLGALPALSDEERARLWAAHTELLALNSACLAALASTDPNAVAVADPYVADGTSLGSAPPASLAAVGGALLDAAHVAEVARAFGGGRLIHAISAVPLTIRQAITRESLAQLVAQLDRLLRRSNASQGSEIWFAIAFQAARDFPPRQALTYQAAVTGLRSALRCLNQLVFQAVQDDRLQAVNDDDIVALNGPSMNIAERLIRLTMQPSSKAMALQPGSLVFVSHSLLPAHLAGLSEIIGMQHEFSEKAGRLQHLTLHLVDADLNPSPLFEHLTR